MDLEKELEGMLVEFSYDEEKMSGTASAKLNDVTGIGEFTFDEEDKDFANTRTAENICRLGATQNLLGKLSNATEDQATKQMYLTGSLELEKEISFYIEGKKKFYDKLRKNRAGDTSDKIKTLHIHEDGTVEELV